MPTETSILCRGPVRQRTMTKPRIKKGEAKQLTSQKTQESKEKRVPSSIHRCRAQIVALKRNNKSLANALDEARQDYRVLQSDNLLLREERQQLLERVARLEKGAHQTAPDVKPTVTFVCEAIRDIEALYVKAQQAKRNIKCIRLPAEHIQNEQMVSPIVDDSETTKGKAHFEEVPENGTSNVVHPKTPHPLCISSMGSHPWFASTPVGIDCQPRPMELTPGAIQFSESETSGSIIRCRSNQITASSKQQHVSPTEANQPPSNDSSPGLPESGGRDSQPQKECVPDCLDSTTDVQRPKRRCKSLSMSYQEPSLSKKLRRGDPFTTTTDWSPSDNRRKNKKKTATTVSRKTVSRKILQQRGVLLDMTNKM